MTDNHVHIGWYSDGYHSPKEVWHSAMAAGIDGMAVSSTSTCAEMYKLVVREMRELIRLGGSRIHPILWLTPRMFHTNCRWALPYMIHSKIRWQGVKMHWLAHKEWYYNRKLLHNALEFANWLNVPVLLHTGDFKECKAGVYKDVCLRYDHLVFVLAHGRPLEETEDVLTTCPNTYVDTAFMPVTHVIELAEAGFANRILYGSDAPINQLFYEDLSTAEYIRNSISELRNALGNDLYQTIMSNQLYK